MRHLLLHVWLPLVVATLVALLTPGCGDDDNSANPTDAGTDAQPSAADAGPAAPLALTVAEPSLNASAGDVVYMAALATGGRGTLTYGWKKTSGPDVVLAGANTLNPSFVAPVAATTTALTFAVSVSDESGQQATASVQVKLDVTPLTADAGSTVKAKAGHLVRLQGRAAGGDGNFSFSWKQQTGAKAKLNDAASSNPSFVAPDAPGSTLTFQLTVRDGNATPAKATVSVQISAGGTTSIGADAGLDATVPALNDVTLSAVGSGVGALSYAWTQTGGSPTVTLTGAGTDNPSFTAPAVTAQTVLTFQVLVTDSNAATATDSVSITVQPVPPLVAAADSASGYAGTTISLHGAALGGVPPLDVVWSVEQPAGVTLSSYNQFNTSFVAPWNATAVNVKLTVTDSVGQVATYAAGVNIVARVARCAQCTQLACLLNGDPVADCPAGFDACVTEVSDPPAGRVLTRRCAKRTEDTALASKNDPACSNVKYNRMPSGVLCTFACDGVTFPACNKPSAEVPPVETLLSSAP